MMDNLAERSPKQSAKLSVIQSSVVSTIQGLSIEVNGSTVRRIGRYIVGFRC